MLAVGPTLPGFILRLWGEGVPHTQSGTGSPKSGREGGSPSTTLKHMHKTLPGGEGGWAQGVDLLSDPRRGHPPPPQSTDPPTKNPPKTNQKPFSLAQPLAGQKTDPWSTPPPGGSSGTPEPPPLRWGHTGFKMNLWFGASWAPPGGGFHWQGVLLRVPALAPENLKFFWKMPIAYSPFLRHCTCM